METYAVRKSSSSNSIGVDSGGVEGVKVEESWFGVDIEDVGGGEARMAVKEAGWEVEWLGARGRRTLLKGGASPLLRS